MDINYKLVLDNAAYNSGMQESLNLLRQLNEEYKKQATSGALGGNQSAGMVAGLQSIIKTNSELLSEMQKLGTAITKATSPTDVQRLRDEILKLKAEIEALKTGVTGIGPSATNAASKIGLLKNELIRLRLEGKANTEEYARVNAQFAKLQATIIAVENSSKQYRKESTALRTSINDTGHTTALAGANLISFGQVLSDLPYGIRGIANNLQQMTATLVGLVGSAGSVGAALKALRLAFMGPLGIIVAVQGAIAALDFFSNMQDKSAKATQDATLKIEEEAVRLNGLLSVYNDLNNTIEITNKAKQDIIDIIGKEVVVTDDLSKAIENYIRIQTLRLEIDSLIEKIAVLQTEEEENRNTALAKEQEKLIEIRKTLARVQESSGTNEIFTKQELLLLEKQSLANIEQLEKKTEIKDSKELTALKEKLKLLLEEVVNLEKAKKAEDEKAKAAEKAYDIWYVNQKNRIAALDANLNKTLESIELERQKEIKIAKEKGYDVALVEAKFYKERLDALNEYNKNVRDTNNSNRIAALEDGLSKQLEKIKESERKEIKEAKFTGVNINLIRAKYEQERLEAIDKFIKDATTLNKKLYKELLDIETKYEDERAKVGGELATIERERVKSQAQIDILQKTYEAEYEETVKALADLEKLKKQNLTKEQKDEIDILEKGLKDKLVLNEKSLEQLRYLRASADDKAEKDRLAFLFNQNEKELENVRDIEKAKIDQIQLNGRKAEEVEKEIARKKLLVDIAYLEKKLELYRKDPTSDPLKVEQIKAEIEKAKRELSKTDPNQFSLAELLGIPEDDLDKLLKSIRIIGKSITEVFNEVNLAAQRNNKQRIDDLNKNISDIEKSIEKETELNQMGLANNLDAEKKHLEELNAQRVAAFEKQKELEKQKLAIDSISQLSSLITASAQMWQANSKIVQPLGSILTIAAIAAMFGSFAVSKKKAADLINSQTFEKGGEVDGKRHTQGGEKYYNASGNSMVEIEGGEFVTNRKSTSKYSQLLEAINKDDIGSHNIHKLLEGTGVVVATPDMDKFKQETKIISGFSSGGSFVSESKTKDVSDEIIEIKNLVKSIANKEQTIFANNSMVTKKNNRTIIVKRDGN